MSKIIGRLNPNSQQRLVVYDTRANAPTLQAAMGEGGGQVPLIMVKKYETRDNQIRQSI